MKFLYVYFGDQWLQLFIIKNADKGAGVPKIQILMQSCRTFTIAGASAGPVIAGILICAKD